jgi:hypothetical protein
MVGKVVTPETAPVTHSVFADQEQEQEEEPVEEEETAPVKKSQDILNTFRHVSVSQVVREPRMWFKRVPKLGAFLAVPLVYNSCLSDEALEAAIADSQDVSMRKAEL